MAVVEVEVELCSLTDCGLCASELVRSQDFEVDVSVFGRLLQVYEWFTIDICGWLNGCLVLIKNFQCK